MDLNDIDEWSRALLQSEARKRGVRTPEVYSRGELIRLILRHDYGSTRSVRGAARLVGGLIGTAKLAMKIGLSRLEPERLTGGSRRVEDVGPRGKAWSARWEPGVDRADVEDADRPGAAEREAFDAPGPIPYPAQPPQPTAAEPREAAAPSDTSSAAMTAVELVSPVAGAARQVDALSDASTPAPSFAEPLQPSAAEARWPVAPPSHADAAPSSAETSALPQPTPFAAPSADDVEELAYGPHPAQGLHVRWRVGSNAIHRAQAVLGTQGELAVRVIAVRVEDASLVRTETLDHGPVESNGDWTAPLSPTAARYVTAIGLRSGDRFVSIAHAAST